MGIGSWANQAAQIKQEYLEACKRIEELREENDKLKAALKPFSDFSIVEEISRSEVNETAPDERSFGLVVSDSCHAELTIGDFRRAAKLLEI